MNRDEERDEEALPSEPDEPQGVIVAGALAGAAPGMAVEEALEGVDSPDSDDEDAKTSD